MKNDNATVRYEVATSGSTRKVIERRGRVTPKRVDIGSRVWDRAGKRASAYNPGSNPARLLSYHVDGEEPVVLNTPMTQEEIRLANRLK